MKLYKNKFRVESTRLKDWDYSSPWWYYVTINTKNKKIWFGKIIDGKMLLNDLGKIAHEAWEAIPSHYKNTLLDDYVIMPNHIHGIVIFNDVETGHAPSLQPVNHTLGNIVGSFKSRVTTEIINISCKDFAWQPRFFDHIIRNEEDFGE